MASIDSANSAVVTDVVRSQYEAMPYPQRDPADENRRLLHTFLDSLPALQHYCYAGRRDFRDNFRVLIAGGGTGDAAIFLAEQLRHADGEIVYLDISKSSMEIARQRAANRRLEKRITWLHGSLLELPKLGLAPFDYINCSGVLHHLADPAAGLAVLRAALRDEGAMGLMLYGKIGRTGLYQTQEMLRMLAPAEMPREERLASARQLLDSLPPTNWQKRGTDCGGTDMEHDAGIFDLFLHSQDRAFTVEEIYELLGGEGLHLAGFSPCLRPHYNPHLVLPAQLSKQIAHLPLPKQQAFAELLYGNINKHEFWATPRPDSAISIDDPDAAPLFSFAARESRMQQFLLNCTEEIAKVETVTPCGLNVQFQVRLDEPTRRFIGLINDGNTLGEIATQVAAAMPADNTQGESLTAARRLIHNLLEAFISGDHILLRHKSAPSTREFMSAEQEGTLSPLPQTPPQSKLQPPQSRALPLPSPHTAPSSELAELNRSRRPRSKRSRRPRQ